MAETHRSDALPAAIHQSHGGCRAEDADFLQGILLQAPPRNDQLRKRHATGLLADVGRLVDSPASELTALDPVLHHGGCG